MKRLAVVVLAGVLGVVLLCLGATQKLLNQSGATASGVALTFSEGVQVTSYDNSVFPTQFPASGESESFTFGGGSLPAGGTFQVTWSPSSARVRSTSWMESLAGTAPQPMAAGTQWRGVNASLELVGPQELRLLAETWNANLVRLMIGTMGAMGNFGTFFSKSHSDPVALPEDLARLDEVLDQCRILGIGVIIDFHECAAWENMDETRGLRTWTSATWRRRLVDFWEVIARHCAGRGAEVYGYDLLNEPIVDFGAWNVLAKELTSAIRKYDRTHRIIVETADWGDVGGFEHLVPTGDANAVYSFHTYWPDAFTGWDDRRSRPRYPTESWNRASMESQIQPAIVFRDKWHVPILVGEFGASILAGPQSCGAYYEDCMKLFEDKGFDYCYYAFRESFRMDLEHEYYRAAWGNFGRYVGTTPALERVLEHFANNVRSPTGGDVGAPRRCLFDKSHWWVGSDRSVIDTELAWRLQGFCTVTDHVSGPITAKDLVGVDLLVTGGIMQPVSEAEAAAVQSFVESGGSLLVYGDESASESVNLLLGDFGVHFDPRCVLRGAYDGPDVRDFCVPFAPIPGVLRNGGTFCMNWGGTLTVSEPVRPILTADAAAWIDANESGARDSGDIRGPFALAAVSESGKGRVAVVSDNPFGYLESWILLSQVVRWLLRLWPLGV